jgi:hypothetical protein
MTHALDRRTFIGRALAAVLSPRATSQPWYRSQLPKTPILRVGLLASQPTYRQRHAGALLGIEEAEHAAELFGGRAELIPLDDLARLPSGLAAIIGDERDDHCRMLNAQQRTAKAPLFMNVACSSDALRAADCRASTFHVYPSDAMLRDAATQSGGAPEVVAWDSSLKRFGADTLNGRFKKRFGFGMSPYAWASWFAVKALWESALRVKSADPSALAEFLTRDTTQFDGHKGRPLSFRRWDHQLRQFVYAHVATGYVDIPKNAPAQIASRDFLDRIGVAAANTTCHLAP